MKKIVVILFIFSLIAVVGCSYEKKSLINNKNVINKNNAQDNVYYFGEGKEWFATYTVSKVRTSYFDSIYIQYINDRTASVDEQQQTSKNLGTIEYKLNAGNTTIQSSYPQQLKGIGNFHTASELNADMINIDFPEEINLEIKWLNKKEYIILKKQE